MIRECDGVEETPTSTKVTHTLVRLTSYINANSSFIVYSLRDRVTVLTDRKQKEIVRLSFTQQIKNCRCTGKDVIKSVITEGDRFSQGRKTCVTTTFRKPGLSKQQPL